jgi:hypothetical protein
MHHGTPDPPPDGRPPGPPPGTCPGFPSRAARLEWRLAKYKALGWAIDWLVHRPRLAWRVLRAGRPAHPAALPNFEARVYSQNGEDGILAEIFRRVGEGDRFLVEFGIGDGAECCGRNLIAHRGWRGVLFEGSGACAAAAAELFRAHPGVAVSHRFLTAENIVGLFRSFAVPPEPDLLVVDVDGNDYWIWERLLTAYRPRVAVIEYNARWVPPTEWVMGYDPVYRLDGSAVHGASLTSLAKLGAAWGYALVGCTTAGVNAFFVRADLLADRFPDHARGPGYHYRPPRYGRGFGHPIRMRVGPGGG